MYKELTKEQYEHRIKQLENVCETVLAYTKQPGFSEQDRLALEHILAKAIFVSDSFKNKGFLTKGANLKRARVREGANLMKNLSTNIFHDKEKTQPICNIGCCCITPTSNLDDYEI